MFDPKKRQKYLADLTLRPHQKDQPQRARVLQDVGFGSALSAGFGIIGAVVGISSSLFFAGPDVDFAVGSLLGGAILGTAIGSVKQLSPVWMRYHKEEQKIFDFRHLIHGLPQSGKDVSVIRDKETVMKTKTREVSDTLADLKKVLETQVHTTPHTLSKEEKQVFDTWVNQLIQPFYDISPGPLGFHQHRALYDLLFQTVKLLHHGHEKLFELYGEVEFKQQLKDKLGEYRSVPTDQPLVKKPTPVDPDSVTSTPVRSILKR